nr:DUF255 domain-containing protein [Paenibacillus antarcticus]
MFQNYSHYSVNWFPWSEYRFVIAKRDNKPIFLSIYLVS